METVAVATKHDPKRRALGKGLESLLPKRPVPVVEIQAEAAAVESEPVAAPVLVQSGKPLEIELDLISRNPFQTRTHFDQEKLKELAQSIAASGVVQPIVVRELPEGRYQLVTGERRWLASYEAGKTHIPAIVRHVSDEQAMEMTIVENLQRADLNPMEQARAYMRLSRDFQMTQEAMATRTGMSRAAVSNFLRLLKLPDDVQRRVEAGELSFGHAKILLGLDAAAISAAAQKVVALSMSVRQTETYVQGLLNPESKVKEAKPEPFQDANVKDMQDKLQQALGLRVKVEDRNGKGKVIIEYGGVDEFDSILEALGGK
jgi:ParB family chromosome partitioning protein